ncbi:MAG: ABC transporter ATP-binding protein [Ignavibacteriales bacterium]|nr:MAG: ABC transporter ATP-binding protein [Ignavibacteriales bacterium]
MNDYFLKAESINKTFGRRLIFKDLSFHFNKPGIYGISGANGSGKSTLVKIIAGINSPSNGKIIHSIGGAEIIPEKLHNYIGFVSPYLVLYDEFSSMENLSHFASIRNISLNTERINYLFNEFKIFDRRNDLVKTYSSGMKQRLKFIFALMHTPELIILDEPTSNLDEDGKSKVYKIIVEEAKNHIVLVASNERTDLQYCSEEIILEKYKNNTE